MAAGCFSRATYFGTVKRMNSNARLVLAAVISAVPAMAISSAMDLNAQGMSWAGLAVFLGCVYVTYNWLGRWAKKE
jgi:hypothetical protein